jgi:hypothetical protein
LPWLRTGIEIAPVRAFDGHPCRNWPQAPLTRQLPELRRWYALGPAAESLIDADRHLPDEVTICRLDGYLEQGTERLHLLENNADAPAGTLFSARINRLVGELLDELGCPYRWTRRSRSALNASYSTCCWTACAASGWTQVRPA